MYGHSIANNRPYSSLCATLFLFSCLFSPVTTAKPNPIPIEVQSDTAEVDGEAGLATHIGTVIMTQGDRHLFGDKLIVERDDRGDVDNLLATGQPARYEGPLDPESPLIVGKAERIQYFPNTNMVILEGDAELQQNSDTFHGPYISYDIERHLVVTQPSEKGRTKIVLQPR